jgi:hypothetical protein
MKEIKPNKKLNQLLRVADLQMYESLRILYRLQN